MAKRPITAKVIHAARRNIKRAQLSRLGTKEPRSVGRMTRSRRIYSRPATPVRRRTR